MLGKLGVCARKAALSTLMLALCAALIVPAALAQLPFQRTKLPAEPIINRFNDPAYPAVDPNIETISPLSLAPQNRPLDPQRAISAVTLQGMLDRIIDAGPRPEVRAKVRIYDDRKRNAQAFGDGTIMISSGLFDELYDRATTIPEDTPQEMRAAVIEENNKKASTFLGFVLSHEYSHVLMRHPQARAKSESQLKQIQNVLVTTGTLYLIGRSLTADPNARAAVQERQAYQAVGVLMASSLVGGFLEGEAKRLVLPGFARETEQDSDMLAVDLMCRYSQARKLNFDPVLGVEALDSVREVNKTLISKVGNLAKDAGKTAQNTAASLALMAPAMMLSKGSTDITKELQAMAALAVMDFVFQKLEERRQLTDIHLHDSVDRRMKLVKDYTAKFCVMPTIAPAERAIPGGAGFAGEVNWDQALNERNASFARDNAESALVRGEIAQARIEIDKVLSTPMGQSAEVQKLAGTIAAGEQDLPRAILHFRQAIAAGLFGSSIYQAIIDLQLRTADRNAALATIAEGEAALGDVGVFLPTKITIFRIEENKAELETALKKCRELTGRLDIVQRCEANALPPEAAALAPGGAQAGSTAAGAAPGAAAEGEEAAEASEDAALTPEQAIQQGAQQAIEGLKRINPFGRKKAEGAGETKPAGQDAQKADGGAAPPPPPPPPK